MTRKDYVLIAEAINSVRCETREAGRDVQQVYEVADRLANRMRGESATFVKGRFMAACGFPVTE